MKPFDDYYRVTEVLKHLNNFDHIPKEILDKAADRGKRVHNYCEMYALNLFYGHIDNDCINYFKAFKQWFDATIEKVIYTENRLFSFERKLTGCVDMVAIIKGDSKPSLIDFKTPSSPSPTWNLQTAAYKLLLRETTDYEVSRRICLMLPKFESKAKIIEYFKHDEEEREFLDIFDNFKQMNEKFA